MKNISSKFCAHMFICLKVILLDRKKEIESIRKMLIKEKQVETEILVAFKPFLKCNEFLVSSFI